MIQPLPVHAAQFSYGSRTRTAKSRRTRIVPSEQDRERLERIRTNPHSILKHVQGATIILHQVPDGERLDPFCLCNGLTGFDLPSAVKPVTIIDSIENRDRLRLLRVYPAIFLARNRSLPISNTSLRQERTRSTKRNLPRSPRSRRRISGRAAGTGVNPRATRSSANPVVGEESTEQGKALFRFLELQEMTGIGHDGVINAECLAEQLATSRGVRRVLGLGV